MTPAEHNRVIARAVTMSIVGIAVATAAIIQVIIREHFEHQRRHAG